MRGGESQQTCPTAFQAVPGPTPSCSTSPSKQLTSLTCCGLSHPLVLHMLVSLPGTPSPCLCVWLTLPREWDSGQRVGFGGPRSQGPVCLAKQGRKQTLSKPDSRSSELRVSRGQDGTEGEEPGVSG